MTSRHDEFHARRVLVTGGCGFIGANVVRGLIDRGCAVRVMDNFSAADGSYLDGLDIELIEGDVRNDDVGLRAAARCDAVIHLAAETSVRDSVVDPIPSFEVNAAGTLAMLRAAVGARVQTFVFASSNAVVGDVASPPVDEDNVPRPQSPYGASKLAGEAYCAAFHGTYGLGAVCLRFANAYGPWSAHKTSVVAKFIQLLLSGEPITIYGDGSQTRDFVFVDDIVSAVVSAMERDVGGETFQIATGRETSIRALIALLAAVTETEPEVEWLPQLPGEIRRSYASIARARARLGFEPGIALEDGLRMTYAWLAERNAPAR